MNFALKDRNLPSTRMCHPGRQRGYAHNLCHERGTRGPVGFETDVPVSRSCFGSLIPAWLNVSEVFSRNAGSRMRGSPLTIPVHPPFGGELYLPREVQPPKFACPSHFPMRIWCNWADISPGCELKSRTQGQRLINIFALFPSGDG